MEINKKKTQVMFLKSRKCDLLLEMEFEDESQVEVISETKLGTLALLPLARSIKMYRLLIGLRIDFLPPT